MSYEPLCVENFVWFLVVLGLFLYFRADAEINGSESPPLARMDSEKTPSPQSTSPMSPSPRGSSPQPRETSKSSSGVGSFLRIRRSRKVSTEQDGAASPPPTSKKRFLRRSKKNKESPEDGSASPSASGASTTPSITPSPSPKPKKSTKASSLVRKLSIGRYRRRASPANTDTSEDERRAGGITPPPPSMMPPPEEEEAQEGDQSQRAAESGEGVTDTAGNASADSIVKVDMKSEPDLEAGSAGGDATPMAAEGEAEGPSPNNASGDGPSEETSPADSPSADNPPSTDPSTAAPKTPTRSQFLSITTPVITAMQDGVKGVPEVAAQSEVASTSVENPLEQPGEAAADSSAIPEETSEDAATDKQTDLIASARHKLSQSLGASRKEPAAQYNGEKREYLYKILVIGELGTGKTSIIKRYVHQFFSQHYRATIGVDFALKVLNWDAATTVRLQLWDIAGQERFGNMTRVYYKEAVGAFIVFDVTRAATFDAVLKWKQDLDSKVQMSDGSPIPCVLLANKCDQPKEGIVNVPNKIDEYCNEHGFTTWFETSAKDNVNIDEAARALVAKILQNDRLLHGGDADGDPNKIALNNRKSSGEQSNGKSCLC